MIHIRVISAENLPVYTKEVRKTRIYCFSSSACRYFYGSFKNKDNTINPKWNGEFDADLLRCSSLSFILFSSRLLSKEVYLGRVDISSMQFSHYLMFFLQFISYIIIFIFSKYLPSNQIPIHFITNNTCFCDIYTIS